MQYVTINREMSIWMRFELLNAHPCMVSTRMCYIVCALMVCLIYAPSALRPAAIGLQVYISGPW